MSPDPKGYVDSSNLYAFCGGDPVNCSDPRGEAGAAKNAPRQQPQRQPNKPPRPGDRPLDPPKLEPPPVPPPLTDAEIIANIDNFAYLVERINAARRHELEQQKKAGKLTVERDAPKPLKDKCSDETLAGLSGAVVSTFGAGPNSTAAATEAAQAHGIFTSVDAQRVLQAIVSEVNARLASNLKLARGVLKDAEYRAGQTDRGLAAPQYGNALERLVAAEIEARGLGDVFFYLAGPGRTDFTACGENYDTHTENMRQIRLHQSRAYKPVSVTYVRPKNFTVFP